MTHLNKLEKMQANSINFPRQHVFILFPLKTFSAEPIFYCYIHLNILISLKNINACIFPDALTNTIQQEGYPR